MDSGKNKYRDLGDSSCLPMLAVREAIIE